MYTSKLQGFFFLKFVWKAPNIFREFSPSKNREKTYVLFLAWFFPTLTICPPFIKSLKNELEYYIIFFSYTISILLSIFIGNSNHLKNSSICSWKQTFLLFSNNFFRFFLPSVYAVLVINLSKPYFCENLMVIRIFKKKIISDSWVFMKKMIWLI